MSWSKLDETLGSCIKTYEFGGRKSIDEMRKFLRYAHCHITEADVITIGVSKCQR